MAFLDYLWIIRLIIEVLKLIADMTPDEKTKIAQLRSDIGDVFS